MNPQKPVILDGNPHHFIQVSSGHKPRNGIAGSDDFGRLCLSKRAVFCRSSAGGLIGRVGPSMNPRPEGLNLVPCAARYDLGVESARRGLTRISRILENCYHPESYMDVQDLVDGRTDGRRIEWRPRPIPWTPWPRRIVMGLERTLPTRVSGWTFSVRGRCFCTKRKRGAFSAREPEPPPFRDPLQSGLGSGSERSHRQLPSLVLALQLGKPSSLPPHPSSLQPASSFPVPTTSLMLPDFPPPWAARKLSRSSTCFGLESLTNTSGAGGRGQGRWQKDSLHLMGAIFISIEVAIEKTHKITQKNTHV
ncbi:uncharacterized protein LOC141578015 [Camelus bactrianus]|uniref:Uncharacterized protein LOC141578015 n=1 Tax=Camelus bactrianus TaxID=9837 RepID=A0AC58QK55_CAMBA